MSKNGCNSAVCLVQSGLGHLIVKERGMFQPDYTNIVDAVQTCAAKRLPLYEHGFAHNVIEEIMGFEVAALFKGSLKDKTEA